MAGGALSVRYTPNSAQANTTNPGTTDNSGTSSIQANYQGSLGVEGLKVMVGYAKDDSFGASTQDGKAKTFGAAYTINGITVGAQRRNYEDVNTAAAQSEYKTNEFGIGFAVNDSLSIALQHIVTDGDNASTNFASKEKITGVGIGYNLGGIAIELSYADVSDANGTTGSDGEAFQLKTVLGTNPIDAVIRNNIEKRNCFFIFSSPNQLENQGNRLYQHTCSMFLAQMGIDQ
jgi:predicted porin